MVRRIRRFIPHVFIFLALLLIAYLPLYRQIAATPKGTFFTKVHGIHEDYYYYLSVIRQGQTSFSETDQYTTEKTTPSRVHLFYLVLGKIDRVIHTGPINMYYGAIFVSLLLFYISSYFLVSYLFHGKYRWLAMGIIFFASPLPPVSLHLFGRSIFLGTEWWTWMDSYNRLRLIPHHFFASSMLVFSSYFIIRFVNGKQGRWIFCCLVTSFLGALFFAVPFFIFLPAVILTTVFYILPFIRTGKFKKQQIILFGVIVLASVIAITIGSVFKELATLGFPWRENLSWEYQTYVKEEYPYLFTIFILSYGLLPLFGLFALPRIFRRPEFARIFIFLMSIIPACYYLLSIAGILKINKIRFVYSAPYVFAGILAVIGIEFLISKIRPPRAAKIVFYTITVIYFINAVVGLFTYWRPKISELNIVNNIYIPKPYFAAMEFLNSQTTHYPGVLASYYTGVYLPAFTWTNVFIGHEVSTYNFWLKWGLAESFFAGKMNESEIKALLNDYRIDYVFWDSGNLPKNYQKLFKPVYIRDGISILIAKNQPRNDL
jgi:hypothetical protein